MRYCFDLDGTLCTQVNLADNHGKDATLEECYDQAKPITERIEWVNSLYDSGFTIIIATARSYGHPEKVEDWMALTEKQLSEWGVKYHELSVGDKIHADLYIDDRATNADEYFKTTGKKDPSPTPIPQEVEFDGVKIMMSDPPSSAKLIKSDEQF